MEILRKELIELREYQINIANTAMKYNTLVILPTGTGKTIIAIIVAANRLTKYPESKILMLAPTRPLCAQHKKTFEKLLKIEPSKIALITGKIPAQDREYLYKISKIIIATPETIRNDLENNRLRLDDFSLLIIDEAHRCVKEYAYTYVAKVYKEQSKYPLIIGLTASPGSEKERIEEIKRNLSIEKVEIRTGKESDIAKYMKKIETYFVYVDLPNELKVAISYLNDLRNELIKWLKEKNVISDENLKKKEIVNLYKEFVEKSEEMNLNQYVKFAIITKIIQLIKVDYMLELLETQSSHFFLEYVEKLKNSKKAYEKALFEDVRIRRAYEIVKQYLSLNVPHPKLVKLIEIIKKLIEVNKNVKIIVFANYRATVDYIYKSLQKENIKVAKLIGQAKKGKDKGMTQREQIYTIRNFAEGYYNVLVCSSIGEEGLDIPKTDYAIFYEPVPSEIRFIQRRGRVGRQESGKIIILLTKGTRDEAYYWAAFHKERKMKRLMIKTKEELEKEIAL